MMRARTGYPTRLLRFARLLLHLAFALVRTAFIYTRVDKERQFQMAARWSRQLLRILNVRLKPTGEPPDFSRGNVLFVGNHVSWLDVFALMAVRPARFVAKAEVRSWPVAGWLCGRMGTLFIEREKRLDTGRISRVIREALAIGDRVAVFPEGTTTDGTSLRHFHTSLLEPAVMADAMLYPVAFRYCFEDGSLSTAPAYVDDMTFMDSIRAILAEPAIYMEINFLEPVRVDGRNRRELTRLVERLIADALQLEVAHRQPGTPGGLPGAPPRADRPRSSPNPPPADLPEGADPALPNARK